VHTIGGMTRRGDPSASSRPSAPASGLDSRGPACSPRRSTGGLIPGSWRRPRATCRATVRTGMPPTTGATAGVTNAPRHTLPPGWNE